MRPVCAPSCCVVAVLAACGSGKRDDRAAAGSANATASQAQAPTTTIPAVTPRAFFKRGVPTYAELLLFAGTGTPGIEEINAPTVMRADAPIVIALWRTGNSPTSFAGDRDDEPAETTTWDHAAITRAIAACLSDTSRAEIEAVRDSDERAMAVRFHQNYYPTRVGERPIIYASRHPRRPLLDLPFLAADYDGVVFPDEPT